MPNTISEPTKPKAVAKKTTVKKAATATQGVVKKRATSTKTVKSEDGNEVEKVVTATPAHHAEKSSGRYTFATGKRKTAIANVRLYDTTGHLTINKQDPKKYFSAPYLLDAAVVPFKITGRGGSLKCEAFISGGGAHSQAEALANALAKALILQDDSLRLILKKNGLLTRDSRKKERKKPGLKRARRAPQWAKR
jgi:small subunit ribosomal protein S9